MEEKGGQDLCELDHDTELETDAPPRGDSDSVLPAPPAGNGVLLVGLPDGDGEKGAGQTDGYESGSTMRVLLLERGEL